VAQFDVYRNTGRHRDDIPYVVLVQSSLYDSYRRRVVVPLVKKSVLGKVANPRFNPAFRIENVPVVLHPLEVVSVGTEQLGEFVVSLRDNGDLIAAALDELLTQAWR
jgi:toxin CcdB